MLPLLAMNDSGSERVLASINPLSKILLNIFLCTLFLISIKKAYINSGTPATGWVNKQARAKTNIQKLLIFPEAIRNRDDISRL